MPQETSLCQVDTYLEQLSSLTVKDWAFGRFDELKRQIIADCQAGRLSGRESLLLAYAFEDALRRLEHTV